MSQNLRELSSAPLLTPQPAQRMSGQGWGYVFGALGAVLFSMKAIFVKLAYQPTNNMPENALDAITLMTLRLGFSVPVYIAILWVLVIKTKRSGQGLPELRVFAGAALLGMLGYYVCAWLDIEGLKYITAQLERLLLFTYPVFVFVLGAMFFGKPLSLKAVVAILIAYSGIAVIFLGGDIASGLNVALGTVMVLTCAFAFAVFQLLAKPMIGRMGSPLFTCTAMLGAGFMIFLHFFVENAHAGTLTSVWDMPPRIYMLGVALAFFSTLMPSFLVNIAIGRIGPQAVAALGMMSPVATIMLAVMWVGEPFGVFDGLGTLLTISGIALYTWFDRRQSQPKSAAPLAK